MALDKINFNGLFKPYNCIKRKPNKELWCSHAGHDVKKCESCGSDVCDECAENNICDWCAMGGDVVMSGN